MTKTAPSPEVVAARLDARRERLQRSQRIAAAVMRGRAAGGPPNDADSARMIAEFHARGGQVTQCEPGDGLTPPGDPARKEIGVPAAEGPKGPET